MKKIILVVGVLSVFSFLTYIASFFIKGDTVNRMEREAFISRGSDDYNVYVMNMGGQPRQYHAVTKVTSEVDKGYYFFWAEVNGRKFYVQSPIGQTLIEQR